MKSLLDKWSFYLYKKLFFFRFFRTQEQEVQKNLSLLHPEKPMASLLAEYYTGKIKLLLLVLLAGSLLALCAGAVGGSEGRLGRDGVVSRSGEETEIVLEVEINSPDQAIKDSIAVTVEPAMLTETEAEKAYRELVTGLGQLILGENTSLQEIRTDLNLPYEVAGYPFEMEWRSRSPLINSEGQVKNDALETAESAVLTAKIFYGELEWEYELDLMVYPPLRTKEEQLIYDLEKMVNSAQEEARYEDSFALPENIAGNDVSWKEQKENYGLLIWGLAVMAAVAVFIMKDKDLQKEVLEQKKQMKEEYPVIVSKFALFLGAGMTVRGAFMKMCKDYDLKRAESPVYKKMLLSGNELQAGVSESKVLEQFGRRTGVPEYAKLCALLGQNIKKGNATLVSRLREECDKALTENINLQKKKGEEAETKLLIPMVMLLAMVMVMIMLPAFSGLGVT